MNAEVFGSDLVLQNKSIALKNVIQQYFGEPHSSPWLIITQERIDAFAAATDDHQWIHTDPVRAAATAFGNTIAHGYLTLSLYPYLRGLVGREADNIPGITRVINYGINRLRFPHPVKCGQQVRGVSKLVSLEAVGEGYQLTESFQVDILDEAKPAMVAEIIMRFFAD